jgi:uncharacterized protein (DUF1330 family)
MAKGYWVVQNDVTDAETYGAYRAAVAPFLAANGARFVVRAGRKIDVEGASRSRHIVIEFDSFEKAVAAYESADDKKIKSLRDKASTGAMTILEGV